MNNNKIKLSGQFRIYMQWPMIMTVLLVAVNVWLYFIDQYAGLVLSAFILLYIGVAVGLYLYSRSLILTDLIQFSTRYDGIQNQLLKELRAPYIITLETGRILWRNNNFNKLFDNDEKTKYLHRIISALTAEIFPQDDQEVTKEITYNHRDYQVTMRRVAVTDLASGEELLQIPPEKEYFIAVSFNDVTELNAHMRESENKHFVAGLIYIDNFEEVMDSVEEVRQSLVAAIVDREISKYITEIDGLCKKLEKDKYFVVLKNESYQKLSEKRFSILKDIKQINAGNSRAVTLSIGLGLNCDTYIGSYNHARVAIDLALARGGDQAVIKDNQEIHYFGGKNEHQSKNTRVKARVKAEALREVMESKDVVMVMGHRIADADSLGACMGIYRAAKRLDKRVHIIVSGITSSIRPLYEEILSDSAYDSQLFITPEKALEFSTDNLLVVVVDTNRAHMVECPELLEKVDAIVVLDHHRQSSKGIDNAVLSYIEPYSSSTCEMVVEILQYIADDIKIPAVEANCLYAGIMIDTRNFLNRTGVRTFEAAAFLRRHGADITRVRKMFRDDMESYRAKAQTIRQAEVYFHEFAIAECPSDIENPTVLAAQAANELLDISGIKASFVVTQYEGKVFLSCRSIDEVNVQIIAERLGGGGHINAAGVQFAEKNVAETIALLKATLNQMIDEGDI